MKFQLETTSIAEPLQNRQHAKSPYLCQIWHAVVYAYRLSLIWTGVLYLPCGAKKLPKYRNFHQIFTFCRNGGRMLLVITQFQWN